MDKNWLKHIRKKIWIKNSFTFGFLVYIFKEKYLYITREKNTYTQNQMP